jgi:hypothetical protein
VIICERFLSTGKSNAVILSEIADERAKQDIKHGDPFQKSYDRLISIIAEEFGEAAMANNDLTTVKGGPGYDVRRSILLADLKHELIQTAACCVQMIEVIVRREAG